MTIELPFEEEYMDVLQNLEAAIVAVYRHNSGLTDYEVENALEALIRTYQGEAIGKHPVVPTSPSSQEVYSAVKEMSEIRLGRSETKQSKKKPKKEPVDLEIIIQTLKHIRKSVVFWTKENGRQGYLQYINKFI